MTRDAGTRRRTFLASCLAAGLAGCAAPSGSPTPTGAARTTDASPATASGTEEGVEIDGNLSWRMGGNGPTNAGYARTRGPSSEPVKVWDVPIEGVFTVPSPTYLDGTLFLGSDTVVYAIDVGEGATDWTRTVDYLAHHYSPAIAGRRLLVPARTMHGARTGGGDGALYALSMDDGAIEWRIDVPVSSGPTVVDGDVYFTSSDDEGVVHAIAPDGTSKWSFEIPPDDGGTGSAFGKPAVLGETIYATASTHHGDGSDTGAVYALDREDGSVRWRRRIDSEARAASLVADAGGAVGSSSEDGEGTVYAAAGGGDLHALDAATGEAVWTHDVGEGILATPAMDGRSVYVLASSTVVAVGRDRGDRAWRTDIGAAAMNGLSVTERRVFVGGTDVTALGSDDGAVHWTYPIPGAGGGFGPPVVLDGVVFTGACIKETPESRYDDHMFALA